MNINIKAICIISGIVLLLAIPNIWPYGFYILLRWFIFITSLLIAYGFYTSKIFKWTLLFGIIAFLFNPLLPVYLNKSTWVILDFIISLFYFLTAYSFKLKK